MQRSKSIGLEETPSALRSIRVRRCRPFSDFEVCQTSRIDHLHKPRHREASDNIGLGITGLPSPPASDGGESSSPKCSFLTLDPGNAINSPPISESGSHSPPTSIVYDGREDDVFSLSPFSHISGPHKTLLDTLEKRSSDLIPFPIQPAIFQSSNSSGADSDLKGAGLKWGRFSPGTPRRISPSTPDRYIADRGVSQSPSRTFRLSKAPHKLSVAEKVLRQNSATANPFTSTGQTRIREGTLRAVSLTQRRTTSITGVLDVPRYFPTASNRVASIGAVWNVGGKTAANSSGPVQSVSNGRGGMIGSGTNAPIYTSNFFESGLSKFEQDCLEGRLAVALDIDQTNRVLNTCRSTEHGSTPVSNPKGTQRKYHSLESQPKWINGEWVVENLATRKCR